MAETKRAPFYDALGADYDRFCDWGERLAFEMPFLRRELGAVDARRVLDLGCGTGQHAIALAGAGLETEGADPSEGLLAIARENAAQSGQKVPFHAVGFGDAAARLGQRFDAIVCLGNALPHAVGPEALARALEDMHAALIPGGRLILQLRNFLPVLANRQRFMHPEDHRQGDEAWLFYRFYDLEDAPEKLRFNMLRLHRQGDVPWTSRIDSVMLSPWTVDDLEKALGKAGFGAQAQYGSLAGDPFDRSQSGDLVIVADRAA